MSKDWTFSGFAGQFDGHVRQHLSWYDLATRAVATIARHYIPTGGLVYDLGAGNGNVARALADILEGRKARLVAIEPEPGFVRAYRGPGRVVQADATAYPYKPFDVAIAFLAWMFLPVAARGELLAALRRNMRPGGAIIVVDKCVLPAGYPATVAARLTAWLKLDAGETPENIARKDLALTGVQRPVNIEELSPCVELFRFGEFAGWLLEK